MFYRVFIGIFLLFALFISKPALSANHAFILGNGAYTKLSVLENTKSDAAAYDTAFTNLGFQVDYHEDLGRDDMEDAFEGFLNRVSPGDKVVFVYSGHGWSDGISNYLIPTDAPVSGTDKKLKRVSVALRNGLDGILDQLEQAGVQLTVAIIDACRNNPFQPAKGKKSASMTRGLARVEAARGTFVIFSAGTGQEALDRLPEDDSSQNLSVFTRSFLPQLAAGQYLEDAISEAGVQTAKLAATFDGHLQEPAYYDQVQGKTCLTERCGAPVQVQTASLCDELYSEAKAEKACYAYEAYAEQCRTHKFAPLAKSFISRRCQAATVAKLQPNVTIGTRVLSPKPPLLLPSIEVLKSCDQLAMHPGNSDNPFKVAAVTFSDMDAARAITACQLAVKNFPDNLRMSFQLGRAFLSDKKYDRAYELYRQGDEKGYVISTSAIGSIYRYGSGRTKNNAEAFKWYEKAAKQGSIDGQYNLAAMYNYGYGVPKDAALAVNWYIKAGKQGDPISQYNLGVMYGNGTGVVKSNTESAKWYQKAADQGEMASQYYLASMYSNGRGVVKDETKAAKLFKMAADQGHKAAQFHLGYIYKKGVGVDQNFAEAIRLYKQAAAQGHASAQNNLGNMYYNGNGVKISYFEAAIWYLKASISDANAPGNFKIVTGNSKNAQLIQKRLKILGFYNGAIDGNFGDGSKAALKAYCKCG